MDILTLIILIPLVGAALTFLVGHFRPEGARIIAILTTLIEMAVVVSASFEACASSTSAISETLIENGTLISWSLTMDGISLPLVVLTGFLTIIAVLASWNITPSPGPHHALLLMLEAMTMGAFLASDIILFYVFWEAVLIPMYFLIGIWGHERRLYASMKFFIYTFLGSILMLLGLLIVSLTTGHFDIAGAVSAGVPAHLQTLVFWLLAIGFLVKVPAFPLHTWLPDAHVEAPTAGSIMLAGILLKMGGYGLIRLAMPLAPAGFADAQGILAALGIIGIVYGAAMALAQTDLKRLVAYSSVAHMGFVLLGIAIGTPAALQAAMLVMVSHGVVSGLLFLLCGILYERTHTRELARFGGLGAVIPGWATVFTFGALASLGLPGLSGFPGEFLAMVEGFRAFGWWLLPATLGLALGAGYNLRAVFSVSQDSTKSEWSSLADLDAREWIAVALLCVAILVLGVWPRFILDIVGPAMSVLVAGGM